MVVLLSFSTIFFDIFNIYQIHCIVFYCIFHKPPATCIACRDVLTLPTCLHTLKYFLKINFMPHCVSKCTNICSTNCLSSVVPSHLPYMVVLISAHVHQVLGLSFERPYLMEGLNLMIPNLGPKTAVFTKNRCFLTPKTTVFTKNCGF